VSIGWRTCLAGTGVLVGVVVLRLGVMDSVTVSSDSMAPTFCAGDRLVVVRAGAGGAAEAGDVVTFRREEDGVRSEWLKRVVAVEGQTVRVDDAVLVVDGSPVAEPYVDLRTVDGTFYQTVTVGQDSVFVLGDSREFSVDSRDFGAVTRSSITGRVAGRLWSGCDHP